MMLSTCRPIRPCTAVRRQTSKPIVTTKVSWKVEMSEPSGPARIIECAEGQTLLDAAEAAGLELPNLCRNGCCGTCSSKVLGGVVDQDLSTTVMTPEQRAEGFVLLCSTYPRSDLKVLTHQEEALTGGPQAYGVS